MSDEHLRKNCPDFKCFRCGLQGHTKTSCDAPRCERCTHFLVNCDEHDEAETENVTEVSDRDEYYNVETDKDGDADNESAKKTKVEMKAMSMTMIWTCLLKEKLSGE